MFNVNFEAMELREKIKEILIKHYHYVDCDDEADELLNLHSVSHQRELLIGLVKYINDHQDYLKGKEFEEVVKEYLSHINCG